MRYPKATACVILLLILLGCSESEQPKPAVPEIPTAQGLHFSVDFFDSALLAIQEAPTSLAGEQHYGHFQQARLRAEDYGTYPQAVLLRAFFALDQAPAAEPDYRDGGYEWDYSWNEPSGPPQSAVLRGVVKDDEVSWSLRDGAGAVWLRGTCAPDSAVTGTWTVWNVGAQGSPRAFQVAWFAEREAHKMEVLFIQEGHSRVGSMLTYEVDTDIHRLHFVDSAFPDQETEIAWHAESLEGMLRASDLHDGSDACWNTLLLDDFCSPVF